MEKISEQQLNEIVKKHEKWLEGKGGERANLGGLDLSGVNLSGENLERANLSRACLIEADLSFSNLGGANLRGANLDDAKLYKANLEYVILVKANLHNADLRSAKLDGVDYSATTAFFALQCPEVGSFTAFKKARGGKIVELEIPATAKRSSATTRKCRCDKAKVVSITCPDGETSYPTAESSFDERFIYRVGEMVEVPDFDEDRWHECSTGIHFFLTRQEAVNY